MKRPLLALCACCACVATLCWAKPAAWYLWRSASADHFICAQISPGPDWEVMKGPFKDALCKKTGEPR